MTHDHVIWLGSSKAALRAMPKGVRADFGYALQEVGEGIKPVQAKPLKGFGSAEVLELRANAASGTYRVVYTVRFASTVYVLHAFQKKSTQGIATQERDIELVRERLKLAQRDYEHRRNQP